jgi:hypothetical protein
LSVSLAACGTPTQSLQLPQYEQRQTRSTGGPSSRPCPDEAKEFARLTQTLISDWRTVIKQIDSPAIRLSSRIAELERIHREISMLEVPECTEGAKVHLLAAIAASLKAFVALSEHKPQEQIDAHLDGANAEMDALQETLATLTGIARHP